jgi:putative ABC transport system permease protein
MNNLIQDLRYAIRVLAKSPAFTIVALLALAIGIGANTAIFSIVNTVLLKPLPYQDPDRLVMVWEDHRPLGGPETEWPSPGNFADWKDKSRSFDRMAALVQWGPTLTGRGEPEDLIASAVSYDMFSMLGVEPVLGRNFSADEDEPGAQRVVVLSDGLWKRRFGADPNIVGSAITLGGDSYTVIGVMPAGFHPPVVTKAELWTTIRRLLSPNCGRGCLVLRVIARLKPGVSLESARAEMSTLAANLAEAYPQTETGIGVTLVGLQDQIVGSVRPMLLVLLGAVALVLLIACANVANLMLARASAREREVAIRTALGASRARIIRQLLTESVSLSIIGGFLGLLFAVWMVDVLVSFSPAGTPRVDEIGIDRTVLAFTFAVAVLTGVLFGLAPALQSAKTDISNSLKEGRGQESGSRGRRIRGALVVAEVAIALTLLIGAGLLVRSFVNLITVDPGFNPSGVLTMSIGLPRSRYQKPAQSASFFSDLIERVKGLPGVESVGAISSLPLGGGGTDADFVIEGRPKPEPGNEPVAWYSSVTPDYFTAMGLKLINGRLFTDRDGADSPQVLLISEKMADRYFPGEDPVGKRIGGGGNPIVWREIVGVVGDVKHFGLDAEARPTMYFPESQIPARGMVLTIRAHGQLLALAGGVRGLVEGLDPDLAISKIRTMEDVRDDSVSPQRFTLLLLGIFAAAALLLASVGIYGVISYSVAQRTHEIGIRMALGAAANDVLRLVVAQGMALVFAGLLTGLGSAYLLARLMQTMLRSLLFGISSTDALTFIAIPFVLAFVALVACFIPARRATTVDPMQALRCE